MPLHVEQFDHVVTRRNGLTSGLDFEISSDLQRIVHRKGLNFSDGIHVGRVIERLKRRRQAKRLMILAANVALGPVAVFTFKSVPLFEDILPH